MDSESDMPAELADTPAHQRGADARDLVLAAPDCIIPQRGFASQPGVARHELPREGHRFLSNKEVQLGFGKLILQLLTKSA